MRWMGTSLAALGVLLAGCQSLPSRDVRTLTSFADAKGRLDAVENTYPLNMRVAVAPTLADYAAGALGVDGDPKEAFGPDFNSDVVDPANVYRLPLSDTETNLQKEVITALQALNLFDEVEEISSQDGREGVGLLTLAAAREIDYLIVPHVRHNYVSYLGANDAWWWPGLLGWIFAWIPTYFVPDETFEAYLDIQLDIYHVRLGDTILAENLELLKPEQNPLRDTERKAALEAALQPARAFRGGAKTTQEADISDLDMGFVTTVPWSAVTVRFFGASWGVLEPGNFVNVSEVVTPPALASNLGEVCKQLAADFAINIAEEGWVEYAQANTTKHNYAVVVGVGDYGDPAFRSYVKTEEDEQASWAAEDARAMYSFLKRCGFREADMELLVNNSSIGNEHPATRQGIIDAILRRRNTLHDDLLVIYLVGYSAIDASVNPDGSLEPGDPFTKYFLPYGAQASNLVGTALPFSDEANSGLVWALNQVQSKNVVLIFDMPFGRTSYIPPHLFSALDKNADGRLNQAEEPTIASSFLEKFQELLPRNILLAAGFNEPILQNERIKRGQYGFQFTEAVRNNRVGPKANLKELTDEVQNRVFRESYFRNQPQQPWVLGNERLPQINLSEKPGSGGN